MDRRDVEGEMGHDKWRGRWVTTSGGEWVDKGDVRRWVDRGDVGARWADRGTARR